MPTGSFQYGGIQQAYSFGALAAGLLAGTLNRQQGPNVPCSNVLIKANTTNTGTIWIGGNDVNSNIGYPLIASESVLLPINNLNLLYYVGSVAADSLRYFIWR